MTIAEKKAYAAGLMTGEGYFGISIVKSPRLKLKHGWKLSPRFAIYMHDKETIEWMASLFEELGLPAYVSARGVGRRIDAQGCKRVRSILSEFLPYLTGQKLRAAQLVSEFIEIRLSVPQNSAYGQREIEIVNELRSVNGGSKPVKRLIESSETTRQTRRDGTLIDVKI